MTGILFSLSVERLSDFDRDKVVCLADFELSDFEVCFEEFCIMRGLEGFSSAFLRWST